MFSWHALVFKGMFTVDSERFRSMNRDADMFVCFSRVHPWYSTCSVVEFNIYAYVVVLIAGATW